MMVQLMISEDIGFSQIRRINAVFVEAAVPRVADERIAIGCTAPIQAVDFFDVGRQI